MRVGDLVEQKYDLYNDGPGIILDIDPAITLSNGYHCNALYLMLYTNGKKDWVTSLALEVLNESR